MVKIRIFCVAKLSNRLEMEIETNQTCGLLGKRSTTSVEKMLIYACSATRGNYYYCHML